MMVYNIWNNWKQFGNQRNDVDFLCLERVGAAVLRGSKCPTTQEGRLFCGATETVCARKNQKVRGASIIIIDVHYFVKDEQW